MILARSHANTSLTNKGERPRVYDAAQFNKREVKRLEKIFETVTQLVFTRNVVEGKQNSTSKPQRSMIFSSFFSSFLDSVKSDAKWLVLY